MGTPRTCSSIGTNGLEHNLKREFLLLPFDVAVKPSLADHGPNAGCQQRTHLLLVLLWEALRAIFAASIHRVNHFGPIAVWKKGACIPLLSYPNPASQNETNPATQIKT